jgi:endonuclease/exonuclease/phosphatase family metal-dependent hydrolase
LRHKGTPLVLCGDLNITTESPALRVFDGWLDDLIRAQPNITTTLTRVNVDRDVVCDHVLVSDDVIVDDFKVSNALISDHYPLILQCH